jgi:NTP pyrophosphatase (non-canonical NTP hydrolase)
MGKFKDLGCPALALVEECAEVIQVINKKFRFNGDWNQIPPGKNKTRFEELKDEMDDVIYQYNRLLEEININ